MKKILFLGDCIEGYPKIASVRYAGIMKYLSKRFDFVVVNDSFFGENRSQYSIENFKFNNKGPVKNIKETNFNLNFKQKVKVKVKNIIKKSYIFKIYKKNQMNERKFIQKNKEVIKAVCDFIEKNKIEAIFITIPSIYPVYILKEINKDHPEIPIIAEIRDIIANEIDTNMSKKILLNCEDSIIELADNIICLSEGIYDYYKNVKNVRNIEIIKNGYNTEDFEECSYKPVMDKDKIVFSHIGSIYGGRNIKDFIIGVDKFAVKENKKCIINLMGNLDSIALEDIESAKKHINANTIINILGMKSPDEALLELKNTDISVILTHKTGSEYAIPGKVFECIGACKPIIAVSEDKNLISLIHNIYGQCAKHDVDDILINIQKILNTDYNFDDRFKFSRKNQADKIENVINTIIGD